MNFMTFHSVGNFIIPTDELIFFRGVETTNIQTLSWDFDGFPLIKQICKKIELLWHVLQRCFIPICSMLWNIYQRLRNINHPVL